MDPNYGWGNALNTPLQNDPAYCQLCVFCQGHAYSNAGAGNCVTPTKGDINCAPRYNGGLPPNCNLADDHKRCRDTYNKEGIMPWQPKYQRNKGRHNTPDPDELAYYTPCAANTIAYSLFINNSNFVSKGLDASWLNDCNMALVTECLPGYKAIFGVTGLSACQRCPPNSINTTRGYSCMQGQRRSEGAAH